MRLKQLSRRGFCKKKIDVLTCIYVGPPMQRWYTVNRTCGGSAQQDCHPAGCQRADIESFLWAANMKVFLGCWLCYFQQKVGGRHSVYVLTWHRDSLHLFSLWSRGNCLVVKRWTESKKRTVCILTDFLKIGSGAFASSWFIHLSCGNS